MPNISLYRKYRPRTFDEVVGQNHITITLKNAIKTSKINHAYLFSGPRGTGKTSVARLLAKAFNCQDGPTETPCNECSNCQEISEGTSIDVLEIDAASNRGIDEIRALKEKVQFAPAKSNYKVYIIDEVHMLTHEAFNALLKILEEPPSHIIFILATTEPHRVLPTILSRCQRFDFRRISLGEIENRLQEIASSEKIDAEPNIFNLIAVKSEGSLRDAIGLLDQLSSFTDKKIVEDNIYQLLGASPFESVYQATNLIISEDLGGLFELINRIVAKGNDLIYFCSQLLGHFRIMLIIKETDETQKLLDIPQNELKLIEEQTKKIQPARISSIIDQLFQAYRDMRWNSDQRLLLELALAKAARQDLDISSSGIIKRLNLLEERITGTQTDIQAKGVVESEIQEKSDDKILEEEKIMSTEDINTHGKLDIQSIRDSWEMVLEEVKKVKRVTHALIIEGRPAEISGNKLIIDFNPESKFHAQELSKDVNLKIIQNAIQNIFNQKITIEIRQAEGESNNIEVSNQVDGDDETDLPETSEPTQEEIDAIRIAQDNLGARIIREQEDY